MIKAKALSRELKRQTLEDEPISDTESIYSIQGRETEYAKDTSDTEEEKLNIVYSSEEATGTKSQPQYNYSGSEMMLAAAAAICEYGSNEEWLTDGDSDSSLEYSGNWNCTKCHSKKANPSFLYCTKCFQDQREMRPPRPKCFKKKHETIKDKPLSQDSGLGSSQDLDQMNCEKRKRKISESSLSDFEVQRSKNRKLLPEAECSKSEPEFRKNSCSSSDLCIACNAEERNSVFIHGKTGHKSCCYKCAMKTWRTIKRCPVCNRKVNNIVKIFAI